MAQPETILIVEDDAGVATLERRRLERAGYRVETAETAEAALRILQAVSIQLILLDYRLPNDADGLEFFAQVRALGFDVPVILVTPDSNEATVIKALRAGVSNFATKTTEHFDYLPEVVAHVLRQVRTEQQLQDSEARLAAVIGQGRHHHCRSGAGHHPLQSRGRAHVPLPCRKGARSVIDALHPVGVGAAACRPVDWREAGRAYLDSPGRVWPLRRPRERRALPP
jgi:CheY-like chemotaxis protein